MASETPGVGRIDETLKWGQPSYLTPETKSGSTLRLGATQDGQVALFTHCQTTIMSDFRSVFGSEFDFDGNRALHLDPQASLPEEPLRMLVASALTYHKKKRA